jgi:hypothetical protein
LVLASPQRPTTVRHLNPPRGQRSRRSVDRTRSPFEPNPISVRGDARDMREHLSIAFSAERGCRRPPYPPHRRGGGRPVVGHERCGRATELDVFRLAAAPGRTFLPSPEDARLSSREASCLGTGDRHKRPTSSTRGTRIVLIESGGLNPDGETAPSLCKGEVVGMAYDPLSTARRRCFGGTLSTGTGWRKPLEPIDSRPPRSWLGFASWRPPPRSRAGRKSSRCRAGWPRSCATPAGSIIRRFRPRGCRWPAAPEPGFGTIVHEANQARRRCPARIPPQQRRVAAGPSRSR